MKRVPVNSVFPQTAYPEGYELSLHKPAAMFPHDLFLGQLQDCGAAN